MFTILYGSWLFSHLPIEKHWKILGLPRLIAIVQQENPAGKNILITFTNLNTNQVPYQSNANHFYYLKEI